MPFHPTQTDIELSPASQASFAIDRLHRLSGDLLLSHILPLTLVERTWLMLPLNAVCFEAPIGKRNGDARSLTRGAAFKTERFESHLGAKWKRRNRANGDTPRSCQSVTPSAPSACAGDTGATALWPEGENSRTAAPLLSDSLDALRPLRPRAHQHTSPHRSLEQ